MALSKLALTLTEDQYQVMLPDEILSVQVQNGPSWRRRDFFGAPAMVSVQFVLTALQYAYLMAFWRLTLVNGTLPFLIDLIIDSPTMTEHQARITKGSFRLTGRRGDAHFVSCNLEVKPNAADTDYDDTLLWLYQEYGDQLPFLLEDFAYIANVLLPASWGPAAG